jgi:hypothetical protein
MTFQMHSLRTDSGVRVLPPQPGSRLFRTAGWAAPRCTKVVLGNRHRKAAIHNRARQRGGHSFLRMALSLVLATEGL